MHTEKEKEVFEGKFYTHPPMRNALISGTLTIAGFSLAHLGAISSGYEIAIYAFSIVIGAYHWAREGIEELFECKEVSIEILMLAAATGSAILGMWDEAAFLVFIYGVAEGLEEFAYARARASIRKLLDLAPKTACLIKNGEMVMVPAESLKVGDIFMVKPGEAVATDGTIIKGRSALNEAPVTGESMPVEKTIGMPVFAASINQEGMLEIKVTATFANNTLSKIVHLVEEAQEKKSKAQLWIDKFGKVYSPLVLFTAAGLALAPLFLDLPSAVWAMKAVVLLVAAAPCALIMSTPVAIAAGIGRAGREGILIKGGVYLENLGKVKAVAFDKTGTLTQGEPLVSDIITLDSTESEVMRLAYSIEQFSEHPIARAIVKKAREMKLTPLETHEFQSLTGMGVQAHVGGKKAYIGKSEYFKQTGEDLSTNAQFKALRGKGRTVMVVGIQERVVGMIAVRDEPRGEAKETIERLHAMGMKIVMLTGDNKDTAMAIAGELGIHDVRADLKPEGKIEAIKDLEKRYGRVIMVGDGINDAPALTEASVGMVMGTAGTDAAIEAADVALMGDDLAKIPYAIELGKRARAVSLQNITFSLFLLLILIPSALIGIMTIALAVFIHEGAELLAVANGLRLSKKAGK